jgi:hypothetical protein
MNLSDASILEQPNNHWSNGLSLEELQKGYQQNQQRKQKQCEYQKKYLEKKKSEVTKLQETVSDLQSQNQTLMSYYQLFELLKLQNPQLADQLVGQFRSKNNLQKAHTSNIALPINIGTPTPFVSQYETILSPSWPMVSLKEETQ